jgi:predicted RNA-binding Zn ribbon-like protein
MAILNQQNSYTGDAMSEHSQAMSTDRPAAPGGLELVQRFINTNDIEQAKDGLTSPAALHDWMVEQRLLTRNDVVTEEDLSRTVALREALRDLAGANAGSAPDERSVATLNRIAAELPLLVQVGGDGTLRQIPSTSGIDGALAQLLARVHTAAIDGTWPRLKTCRNDGCRWAFFDYSKNRSGAWCDMADCGNQFKARAYRRRLKSGDRPAKS